MCEALWDMQLRLKDVSRSLRRTRKMNEQTKFKNDLGNIFLNLNISREREKSFTFVSTLIDIMKRWTIIH